jgi:hypothetical protein
MPTLFRVKAGEKFLKEASKDNFILPESMELNPWGSILIIIIIIMSIFKGEKYGINRSPAFVFKSSIFIEYVLSYNNLMQN